MFGFQGNTVSWLHCVYINCVLANNLKYSPNSLAGSFFMSCNPQSYLKLSRLKLQIFLKVLLQVPTLSALPLSYTLQFMRPFACVLQHLQVVRQRKRWKFLAATRPFPKACWYEQWPVLLPLIRPFGARIQITTRAIGSCSMRISTERSCFLVVEFQVRLFISRD